LTVWGPNAYTRGTMRKRGFRRGTSRRRSKFRYEVSQVSLQQTANVTSDFTRDDPLTLSFELLSQFGLITTNSINTSPASRAAVIDSSIRGVAVASIYYDFNVLFTPVLEDPIGIARFFIECADCVYVDDIASSTTPAMEPGFSPQTIPNLFSNQVGNQVFDSTDSTEQGGFSEIFQFPDRVLYRRWGSLEGATIKGTGNTAVDQGALMGLPTTSLKSQSPVDYAAKRIKRRCFLKDDQGLFVGVNLVGHNPDPVDVAVQCNAVLVYRTVR